ncbi:MAG: transporter substrate-binding domain-containing protein [Bdellovibrionales bacterium]|nr:transporter substrate-binding domain-containing protein [Bdellovibrionales bacterium]
MFFKLFFITAITFGSVTRTKDTLFVAVENSDNYPFSKITSSGEPIGLHADLINAVTKKAGLKVHWVPLPWNRAILSVKRGEVDAISYVSPTKERMSDMSFRPHNSLHTEQICVVVRRDFKEKKFNGKIESLFGEKVGLATNYIPSSEIVANKNKFQLFEYTVDGERIIAMLIAGRFDYTFANNLGYVRSQSNPRYEKTVKLSPCLHGDKRYIAFSKRSVGAEDKGLIFENAMEAFKKTSEYKKVMSLYGVTDI